MTDLPDNFRTRSRAARILARISDFFALRPAPGNLNSGLRAGTASGTAIICACLVFGPRVGAISLFGSLLAMWEADRPLWARVRHGLLIASTMTASMIFGVLLAPYHLVVIPFVVVLIWVMTIAYYGFLLTRGPGPLHLYYGGVLGTYFGQNPEVGWKIVEVTAFCAYLTAALTVLALAYRPRRPEHLAVQHARDAVADYRALAASAPEDQERRRRDFAYGAVARGWLLLSSAWPSISSEVHTRLRRELLGINRNLAAAVMTRLHIPGQVRELDEAVPALLGRPSIPFLLAHALQPTSVAMYTACRLAAAAAIAGVISNLARIGHPYWSILTCTIVLHQWIAHAATVRRALHRAIGTIIGLCVVALVVTLNPSPWPVVLIVIAALFGQNLLLPRNYALALMCVTPMALLAIEAAGQGGSLRELLTDRLLGTLIGVAVALLVAAATSRYFPALILRRQSTRTARATQLVVDITQQSDPFSLAGREARARLQYELLHHLAILDRAAADMPALDALRAEEHVIADSGYAALAAAWRSEKRRP